MSTTIRRGQWPQDAQTNPGTGTPVRSCTCGAFAVTPGHVCNPPRPRNGQR